MRGLIEVLDAVIAGLRGGAVALLAGAAGLAALAWAVRARKVNPFGGPARFARLRLDPLLAPVDRRLARAGVPAANVPWWALLFVLVVLAAAIFVVTFVRDAVVGAYLAGAAGPRGWLSLAVRGTFGFLQLALLVRVLTSWVGGAYSWAGRQAFRLTEWFLGPLRRLIPPMGQLDLTPIVAWFLLGLVQGAFLTVL